jgi:hypothetical protein
MIVIFLPELSSLEKRTKEPIVKHLSVSFDTGTLYVTRSEGVLPFHQYVPAIGKA